MAYNDCSDYEHRHHLGRIPYKGTTSRKVMYQETDILHNSTQALESVFAFDKERAVVVIMNVAKTVLTDRQYQVYVRKIIHKMSLTEIASELSIDKSVVCRHWHTADKKMHKIFDCFEMKRGDILRLKDLDEV